MFAHSNFSAYEVPKKDCNLESASVLDFEIPILDVKFAPQQDGKSKSVIKALLRNSPESDIVVPSDEEAPKASPSQAQSNFIELGDVNRSDVTVNSSFCCGRGVLQLARGACRF